MFKQSSFDRYGFNSLKWFSSEKLHTLILFLVAARLLDYEGQAEERGLEAFWRVGIKLFEKRLELASGTL